MSNRLDKRREATLTPDRMSFAREQIVSAGYAIEFEGATSLQFKFRGQTIVFFPYSGWATGKTIRDGRGIEKLMKQIKK